MRNTLFKQLVHYLHTLLEGGRKEWKSSHLKKMLHIFGLMILLSAQGLYCNCRNVVFVQVFPQQSWKV
ncbi:hypothetical protein MRB53_033332 [Persea americana]|uniref:Uncharacterized protein n=1 Tax=Persea americana TaxID=3435 RepID=A0ACC2KUQ8_PERAE|nr:hypothetical protein MRB53_033332 [Persea americana]